MDFRGSEALSVGRDLNPAEAVRFSSLDPSGDRPCHPRVFTLAKLAARRGLAVHAATAA